jgi:ppGpp synthetase/RelA/SpoT-type nucleotidyltranferase
MSVDPKIIEEHAKKSLLAYVAVRDLYASFAEAIKKILEAALSEHPIHTVQSRAKDFDSFSGKASKIDQDTGELKYIDPLREITDLAGVRVITYVPQTVRDVEDAIRREFNVQERLDKDAALLGSGQIGYKSIHFLVQIKEPRVQATEYSRYSSLVAEIQVRTILQHAWAEMEHDIQYKSDQQIPNDLKRRFVALAGLLEIADREFQSIQQEDERLRTELRIELTQALSQLEASGEISSVITAKIGENVDSSKIMKHTDQRIVRALDRYNELIDGAPGQYAHFVGRAKAKFLLGDRSGALQDLDAAEKLAPGNSQIATVRQRIEEGRLYGKNPSTVATQYAAQGHRSLAAGNISEAKSGYSEAESLGLGKVHSSFNFAMCACLENDMDGMERCLNSVTPHQGSFIEVNHLALRIVAREISGKNNQNVGEMTSELRGLIEKIGSYELENSPLRFLLAALRLPENKERLIRIEGVLNILNHARPA